MGPSTSRDEAGTFRFDDKVHHHTHEGCTTWPRKFSALCQYKIHDFSDVDPPLKRDAQTVRLQHLSVRDPNNIYQLPGSVGPY
jgi:hypothetical protein